MKKILLNNFVGGIAWGLGVTIGLSLFLTILSFLLNKIDFIPIIGDFIARINDYVLQKNPQLIK